MGTVYLAAHPRLPRLVALKLLNPALTDDPALCARFLREAGNIARLDHPNVVTAYDRGQDGEQLWIAMQYIEGSDAGTLLRKQPNIDMDRAVRILAEAARGLDYAHANGMLHRDVKPANILLGEPRPGHGPLERVLIADFGIAKSLEDTAGLTTTGTILASFPYAAPEQLDPAAELDERTDVYALGCTFYHLLVGAPPYPGTSPAHMISGHLYAPIPQPSKETRGRVPAGFDAVIAKALAKNRDERYESCGALARDAERALAEGDDAATVAVRQSPVPTWPTTAETELYPLAAPAALESERGGAEATPAIRRAAPAADSPPATRRPEPATGTASSISRPERAAARTHWNTKRTKWIAATAVLAAVATLITVLVVQSRHQGSDAPTEHGAATVTQSEITTQSGWQGSALAVDSSGNLYIDGKTAGVVQYPYGAPPPVEKLTPQSTYPDGIAVDANGAIYVSNRSTAKVVKYEPGSTTPIDVPVGAAAPTALTFDQAGTLYILDGKRVLKLESGATTASELPTPGMPDSANDIAVDQSGALYLTWGAPGGILKWAAGATEPTVLWSIAGRSGTTIDTPGADLNFPHGIDVDVNDAVYVADALQRAVFRLDAGGTQWQRVPIEGLGYPQALAVDHSGTIYVGDNDRIVRYSG